MPKISVVIVNYNARYFLKNCISSVLKSAGLSDIEIIVVDNNSADDSCMMLKKDFPAIKLIQNKQNTGFSKANNQGVAAASGEYILVLNPDTVLSSQTIQQVYEFSRKTDNIGALGVQFIDGSGCFLPECKRNFPGPKVAALKILGFSNTYYAHQIEQGAISQVDILTGAFMFIKKAVFEKVEGFDEDFFMYGEDIDLSYRIAQAGYKNYYLGSEVILHYKGESTSRDPMYFRNFYGAMHIFYKKHYKTNFIVSGLMDRMVDAMVLINSRSLKNAEKPENKCVNWVYLGNNEMVYAKLLNKFTGASGSMIHEISKKTMEVDMLFFDSAYLTFSEIIIYLAQQKGPSFAKRIIAEDGSFYIGSDTSDGKGEVVLL
jgi:GT2 family glycosyltransferase